MVGGAAEVTCERVKMNWPNSWILSVRSKLARAKALWRELALRKDWVLADQSVYFQSPPTNVSDVSSDP